MNRIWGIPLIGVALAWPAVAAPVGRDQVRAMVAGWRMLDDTPLEAPISSSMPRIEEIQGQDGSPLYFIVHLEPEGYLLVAPDDEIEPVIAFSEHGRYIRDDMNPLTVLIEADMRGRKSAVALPKKGEGPSTRLKTEARDKWQKWMALASSASSPAGKQGVSSPDDVRVAPLLTSKWAQGTVGGNACYNYYTPPYGAGVASNYPGGCTQTAWAQIMRYCCWPQTSIGVVTRTIQVDGVAQESTTRGLVYDWDLMPMVPDGNTPELQRQAIGGLIHDLGVVNQASYTAMGTASGMSVDDLVQVFGYSSAKYTSPDYASLSNILACAVNANLDAGRVVQLSLTGGGSHAVVVDGYGVHAGAVMHHLNLGWGENLDAWYQLPEVGVGGSAYTVVAGVVYNIYTNGSGEIISGRTIDPEGNPITGAVVRISGGSIEKETISNAHGVFAFTQLPSHSEYLLTATNGTHWFPGVTQATGYSATYGASGNRGGMDLVGLTPWHTSVLGVVTNRRGEGLAGITIWIEATERAITDERGAYLVWGLWTNSVEVSVHQEGVVFEEARRVVDLEPGSAAQVNFCGAALYFVDEHAVGDNTGSGWPNAFTNLQVALGTVPDYSDVWVKRGVYKPLECSRTNRFIVGAGVYLLGGFTGGETSADARAPQENQTVLSGDIGVVGEDSDNVKTVLQIMQHARVSGFTIRGGRGEGSVFGGGARLDSEALVSDCTITDNKAMYGGGVYGGRVCRCVISNNYASGNGGGVLGSDLENCILTGNDTFSKGGGICGGSAVNCLLADNSATDGGGAYSSHLVHCTISRNYAHNGGGAAVSSMDNCIIYYNSASRNVNCDGGTLRSCCMPSVLEGGGLTNKPIFVNVSMGDYHLAASSPCIGAGSNALTSSFFDLDGNPRMTGNRTDMGAFEFFGEPTTYESWAAAIGNGDTNEWDSAAGDGIPNLLRYATGGNPVVPDLFPHLEVGHGAASMILCFYRNIEAQDLVVVVESSESLSEESEWNDLAINTGGSWNGSFRVWESGTGNPALVVVHDFDSPASATSRYYRLKVSKWAR